MSNEPGFDFINLTRPQWRHLAKVQKKHGIAWHQYIKILIQRDMAKEITGEEEVRISPMEGKAPITSDAVNNLITKINELLERPVQAIPTYYTQMPGAPPPNIVEESGLKPSDLKKEFKPVKAYAPGTRMSIMEELHQKFNLPPPGKKVKIEFFESITFSGEDEKKEVIVDTEENESV